MKRYVYPIGVLIFLLTFLGTETAYAQGGATYVVQRGDTMLHIAARHGLTATQLAAANGLRWNAWVYVGQRLKIPGPSSSSAPVTPATSHKVRWTSATTGGTYVVRPGNTLTGIARRNGVTVSQLAAANGLRTNAWVYVGQRLKIPGATSTPTTPATSGTSAAPMGGNYIVRPGDTLISIAARHRVTVGQLARANGMHTNSWVYVGQRLKTPGQSATSGPTAPSGGIYVVRPGDTLIGIAIRHGIGVSRLAAANGLYTNSWVYVGQRLKIPGATGTSTPTSPASPLGDTRANPRHPGGQGAAQSTGSDSGTSAAPVGWIDVNLSTQTLTAYAGQKVVFQTRVSTGTWRYPTVVGTFRIYVKYTAARMRGPGYDLPNVPYVMYFYRGYGLHGTYWHNNFGTPMSHGCVNLSVADARWLFNWASVGTKVVTHY